MTTILDWVHNTILNAWIAMNLANNIPNYYYCIESYICWEWKRNDTIINHNFAYSFDMHTIDAFRVGICQRSFIKSQFLCVSGINEFCFSPIFFPVLFFFLQTKVLRHFASVEWRCQFVVFLHFYPFLFVPLKGALSTLLTAHFCCSSEGNAIYIGL